MRKLFLLLLVLLIPAGVYGDEGSKSPFTGFIKFRKYHVSYEVNPDGTHSETAEILVEVLTEEGVEIANQASASYSESLEEVKVLSAYTLKKDGTRVDVPAANMQERAAIAGGGPMFSDIKTRVIIFPDVEKGDSVAYSIKSVQKAALFPGHFSMSYAFGDSTVYDDVRISLSAPSGMAFSVFSTGVKGPEEAQKDGRKQWVWKYSNGNIRLPEPGSIAPLDYAPRIMASTFKDYGALAAAYEERANPRARVTEKVRALAGEITRDIKGEREQAAALYTWVAQNIGYAGNCLGVGSVVPHDADTVLANRLGDCKDHTALLQALLKAKNIDSTPALVNMGLSFKLPEVASVSAFNHVITYIPSLDLYADSTSEFIPFGLLPVGESEKPVIHTAKYTGIKKTPPTDFRQNRSRTRLVMNIDKDGSASGETSNEDSGAFAVGVRAAFAGLPPNMEDRLMGGILSRSGFTGTGKLVKSDPREMKQSYAYGISFQIRNALSLPGPGAFTIKPVFPGAAPISSVLGDLNMPERTMEFACFGGSSVEEYSINLPEDVKVVSLPKDVSVASSRYSYKSTYSRKGSNITVERRFEDRTPGNLCTPKDDMEFRPIGNAILKDLKSQVVYE